MQTIDGITTKQLLERTGISEPTLRRWLKDGHPVPELLDCARDWRGHRDWQARHVEAVLKYQEQKRRQYQNGGGKSASRADQDGSRGGRDERGQSKGNRVAQRRT